MNLAEILQLKFPQANFITDIKLADEGSGPFIKEWNLDGVTQPNAEDLIAFESEVAAAFAEQEVRYARLAGYINEGCDLNSMVVALWELVVEDRPEAAEALQIKREAVKTANPKPV